MQQEYAAVIEMLRRYYDGLYRCDTSLLETVFHPQAHYTTASGETLLHLDMKSYFAVLQKRPSPESSGEPYDFHIDAIEFAGPVTAFARLHGTMFSRTFIDFLTLIKSDSEWRIMSKVFHYDELS